MKPIFLLSFALLAGSAAIAQPIVSAVVNAASNSIPGLPNSAIAQGSMFVVYGKSLGPASLVQVSTFPLPTTLSGTSVKVTVNGTAADAIMIYTSAAQVAAVLPSTTPVGTGTIAVTYNGQASNSAPITVVQSNFGVFAVNQGGSGPGIVTYADYSVVGLNKAANPGETLLIWGTGLGPVTGNEAAGPLPGNLPNVPVEVYVGGKLANLTYRGRSGCCTGLDQIAFVVPAGVEGCSVPVVVKIGSSVSNFTSFPIAANSRTCMDPSGFNGSDLQTLFSKPNVTIGGVSLTRSISQSAGIGGFGGGTTKSDDGVGSFTKITVPPGFSAASLVTNVSYGACTVMTFSGQTANLYGNFMVQNLDAGPSIAVNGPSGSRTLAKSSGFYSAKLGDTTPGNYLDQGRYTITGTGGADIGSFSASLSVPQPLVWTNEDSINTVNRSNGVSVTWSGGDPSGNVTISGTSFAVLPGNNFVGASFTCLAKVSDGSFTVPPVVLLSLPASSTVAGFAFPGSLDVSTSTVPQRITASGLDYGYVVSSVSNDKSVTYQ